VAGGPFRLYLEPGGPPPVISRDLASFLESGVSVQVGTRNAQLEPECVRAAGASVGGSGTELTIFLPAATSARTLSNLRACGRVAVVFARARDNRSVQVKGGVLEVHDATLDEGAAIERYLATLADELAVVGVPPAVVLRMAHSPCHAVRLRVEAVFVQTPGPNAGTPLAGAEAGAR
jgi:hypothetical protein